MQVIWSPNCTLPYLKIQDTRWNPANLIHPGDENSWNLFKFGNLNLTRPASKASSPERRLVSPSASLSGDPDKTGRSHSPHCEFECANKILVLDGFGVIRARKIFRAPHNRTFNMGCYGMPWASLAPPPLPQVLDRRCCYFHRRTQSAPALSVVIAMDLFPVSRYHRSSREMIKTFQRSLEIQGGFLRSPNKMMAMRLATSSNSGSLDAIAWAHNTVTSLSIKWSQDSKSGCHRCVANIRLRLEWCPWSSMFFSNFVFIVCTVASIVSNRTASEHHKSGTCLFAFRSSAPHYQPSGSNHQTFPSLQRQTPVWSVAPTVPPGSRYLAGTFKYQNRDILCYTAVLVTLEKTKFDWFSSVFSTETHGFGITSASPSKGLSQQSQVHIEHGAEGLRSHTKSVFCVYECIWCICIWVYASVLYCFLMAKDGWSIQLNIEFEQNLFEVSRSHLSPVTSHHRHHRHHPLPSPPRSSKIIQDPGIHRDGVPCSLLPRGKLGKSWLNIFVRIAAE